MPRDFAAAGGFRYPGGFPYRAGLARQHYLASVAARGNAAAMALTCFAPSNVPCLADALLDLCERLAGARTTRRPFVRVKLAGAAACPAGLDHVVLRTVDELLSNALEHGFDERQHGLVTVQVVCSKAVGVCISVSDDGRGFDQGGQGCQPAAWSDGNGFRLLRLIGALYIGRSAAAEGMGATVTVVIPWRRRDWCAGDKDGPLHGATVRCSLN